MGMSTVAFQTDIHFLRIRAPESTSRDWPSCNAFRDSWVTSGWAQLPPTQPWKLPSGWTMALAPGFAEVGRFAGHNGRKNEGFALLLENSDLLATGHRTSSAT